MKKILAVRNDRFGEFLLNIPALRALKNSFPDHALHLLCAPSVEELAKALPLIDKVFIRPLGNCPWWEDLSLAFRLRQEQYASAVVLNPSREAHHLIFLAGIPVRVGYRRKHHFLLTKTMDDHNNFGRMHEVDYNLNLVSLLRASTLDKSLSLNIPEEFKAAVLKKFGIDASQPLIAVHPWTSDPVKQWPLERFKDLVGLVTAKFRGCVVIIGKPESWHENIVFESTRIIDLRGRTTLLEAAAVLKACRVLVSCDSGPVHLAASVGTPVVALFRNDMPGKTPRRWGPWGKGHVVIEAAGMEKISVVQVETAVFQMIGKA